MKRAIVFLGIIAALAACTALPQGDGVSTAVGEDSASEVYNKQFHFAKCSPFVFQSLLGNNIAQYTLRMRSGGSQITLLYKFAQRDYPVQEFAYVGKAKQPTLTVQLSAARMVVLNASQNVGFQLNDYLPSAVAEGFSVDGGAGAAEGEDAGASDQDREDAFGAILCDLPESLAAAHASSTPAFFLDEQQEDVADSGGITAYSQDGSPLFPWTGEDGGPAAGTVFNALDAVNCLVPTDGMYQSFTWGCQ
jgi:hypothetical protein